MVWFRRNLIAAAALLSAMLSGAPSRATTVIQPSLEQMSARSEVIVHAIVEDQSVTFGENGARVLTLTRLRIVDGIKGAKTGETVTLYQVGGEVGDRVMRVVGVNEFRKGEEVVLFGARFIAHDTVKFLQENRKADVPADTLNPSGGWLVVYAIGLGKFVVQRDGDTAMAVEEPGDVAAATRVGNKTVHVPVARTMQPLNVFKDEVRRMAVGRAP